MAASFALVGGLLTFVTFFVSAGLYGFKVEAWADALLIISLLLAGIAIAAAVRASLPYDRLKRLLKPHEELLVAATDGDVNAIDRLAARYPEYLDLPDEDTGDTPLHRAFFFCQKAAAERLLALGVERSVLNRKGLTP